MKDEQPKNIFADIQNEVGAESAPLLEFITRYAAWIAGFVILLLLILGGMAIWNWQAGKKLAQTRNELARINLQLKDAEKIAALNKLFQKAPENAKLFILLNIGESALEANNPAEAAKAYAQAAELGGNTALGLAAALSNAGVLLMQDKGLEAFSLLKGLAANQPQLNQKPQFLQLLAEAAAKAGDKKAASQAYENLAKYSDPQESAYFKSRAAQLSAD